MDTEDGAPAAAHAPPPAAAGGYSGPEAKRFDDISFSYSLNRDKVPVVYLRDPHEPVTGMNPYQAPMVTLTDVSLPFGVSTKYSKPGDAKFDVPMTLDTPEKLNYFIGLDEVFLDYVVQREIQQAFFPDREPLTREEYIRDRFRTLIKHDNPKYKPKVNVKICLDPGHRDFIELRFGEYNDAGDLVHTAMDWKALPATISPRQFVIEMLKPTENNTYDVVIKHNGGHKAPNKTVGQSLVFKTIIIKKRRAVDNAVHYPGITGAGKTDLNAFGIDLSKMAAASAPPAAPPGAPPQGFAPQPQGMYYQQGAPGGFVPQGAPQYYQQRPGHGAGAGSASAMPGGFDASAFGYAQ